MSAQAISRKAIELRKHRFLMRIAFATANLFAWIFVFQYFYSKTEDIGLGLIGVALLYALAQDITLLLTPLSARRIRNGVQRPMVQAVLLASLGLIALGATFAGIFGSYVGYGVLLYALFYGAYRAFYWVPYEVDASRFGENTITSNSMEVVCALMPAIVGFVLAFGYPSHLWVLFGSAALMLSSILPLLKVPDTHEGFSWGYRRTFHELCTPRHHTLVLCGIADGIAGAALLLFWPIAAFLIVGWSYALLGIVLSTTFLLVLAFRTQIRNALKAIKLHDSLLVHATLAASSWLLRLTVASPVGIVLVDSYFYAGTAVRGTGIDPFIFEQSADRGSYVDEYTALKEISMAIGKIIMCLLAVFLATSLALPFVFIGIFSIAAVASAVSVYLARIAVQV